jgi:prepilin-type N-terminal cleavage/methylation domain-containing protein
MKKKGFTLVELLVVIAIIALLMGILLPALARVKMLAVRMVCGSNLSSIGKSMMIYSNENDNLYPRSGWRYTMWGNRTRNWKGETRLEAYGRQMSTATQASQSTASIGSCFYLLIKYADLVPKNFICKGDAGSVEFPIKDIIDADLPSGKQMVDFAEAWDFGNTPAKHYSYSLQNPFITIHRAANGRIVFDMYPVTPDGSPEKPIASDRNPYLDFYAKGLQVQQIFGYLDGKHKYDIEEEPYWDNDDGYIDVDKTSNSASHQREGQNVLFNDHHVKFEPFPNCGIDKDNIFKWWTVDRPDDQQKQLGYLFDDSRGNPTTDGSGWVSGDEDAVLISEEKTMASLR